MSDFEKWFVDQDFYTNMRFIYGENLFHKDLGVYRILPVQMTFKAWEGQKAKLDNMEQCYIQEKKQLEDAIYLKDEHRKRRCQLARELTRKSLQELEINQISQSNQEWQRINSELQKQVDDCAALAKEWRTLAREMCPLDDKYVIGARLGCAQDIEEVLRGES